MLTRLAIHSVRIAMAIVAAKQEQRPIHRWLVDWRPAANTAHRIRRRIDDQVELIAKFLAQRSDVVLDDVGTAAFVIVHSVDGLIAGVTERPDLDAQKIARAAIAMVTGFVTRR